MNYLKIRVSLILAVILLIIFLLGFEVSANNIWERYVKIDDRGILIGLSANPSSPFAEEKIAFIALFRDADSGQYLKNITSLKFQVDAVAVPDKSGIVYISSPIEVKDGSVEFSYAFEAPGVYDFHLLFTDEKGQERKAGFMVQARKAPEKSESIRPKYFYFLSTAVISVLIGIIIGQFIRFKKYG